MFFGLLGGFQGRVCGLSLGEGTGVQGRGNRPRLCPGCRAAQVDLMVDLPVGVLGTRGSFSPLLERFHLKIAAKEKLRTAMVIMCVVKDLHNTSFHQRTLTALLELIWWISKAGLGERGFGRTPGRSSGSLQRVSVLPG